MKARIVIGSNYGDESKGTIVAAYTKQSENVLNILTNGGAQRGHSILTKDGNITNQHFGSGTYFGAANYYSRFFILNPMQFVKEYKTLIVKPKIFRDARCLWSTPFDSIANAIEEERKGTHGSCRMGIWNTIKRTREMGFHPFDMFLQNSPTLWLQKVRRYYERNMVIPESWKSIWNAPGLVQHFIEDCQFMFLHTKVCELSSLNYDNLIFENGQGLLLCDTGKDTFDTTPSNTGILYSLELLKDLPEMDVTAHYVTRPYLTRHGDGHIEGKVANNYSLSYSVEEDRTNHFNEAQGVFRYGKLDIGALKERIEKDARDVSYVLEVTHCDEMDREREFRQLFKDVSFRDTPLV